MTVYTPQPVLPSRQVPQHSSREPPSGASSDPWAPPSAATDPWAPPSTHRNFEPIAARPEPLRPVPESIQQAHAAQTLHRSPADSQRPTDPRKRYRGQAVSDLFSVKNSELINFRACRKLVVVKQLIQFKLLAQCPPSHRETTSTIMLKTCFTEFTKRSSQFLTTFAVK